jgi:hypothetical protein
MYQGVQEQVKKPSFFPGISTQIMTHADPPFPATDTQPLPPINMPRGQECVPSTLKQGRFSQVEKSLSKVALWEVAVSCVRLGF